MDDELRRHLDDMAQQISHGFERLEERFLATLDKSRTDRPQDPASNANLQQLDRLGKLEELVDLFPGERPADALKARLAAIDERLERIEHRLDTETAKDDPVAPRLDSTRLSGRPVLSDLEAHTVRCPPSGERAARDRR